MKKTKKTSRTSKKNTILIVEDDNYLANVYRLKLEKFGYSVTMAEDGEKALKMINEQNPDLILLDLIIPKIDGFNVLEKIKKSGKKKNIVLVISNLAQQEDADRVKKLGADEYMVKSSVTLDHLIEKINTYCGR